MSSEQVCAKCLQPTVAVHVLNLDQGRRTWLICCLCLLELIAALDHAAEKSER